MWPIPQITDDNRAFWTGGGNGELLIAQCQDCGFRLHPPTPRCPACLSTRIEPTPISGRGQVYTFTINRRAWTDDSEVPYVIAIVQLDEAPDVRLLTNITGCAPEDVEIGMPVDVGFEARGDVFLPVFHPAAT